MSPTLACARCGQEHPKNNQSISCGRPGGHRLLWFCECLWPDFDGIECRNCHRIPLVEIRRRAERRQGRAESDAVFGRSRGTRRT